MKIGVTYEFGNIFQHFGHTEFVKIYEIENGKTVSSHILSTIGSGHEALAGFLAESGVDVLICGGIGTGAVNALEQAGITLVSGAKGDADSAVSDYLSGKLVSVGVNCDHHENEHSCKHSRH